jgi:hydroxymethylpyrimidine/phosphomethylpyrimidine kinase
MLGSIEMVDTVVELLRAHPHLPLVCDPVLRAGGGGAWARTKSATHARALLPLSTIATPTCPKPASSPNCPKAPRTSAPKNCCRSSSTC